MFRPLVDGLLNWDTYMLFADFQSYLDTQAQVNTVYQDPTQWTRMSILNVARSPLGEVLIRPDDLRIRAGYLARVAGSHSPVVTERIDARVDGGSYFRKLISICTPLMSNRNNCRTMLPGLSFSRTATPRWRIRANIPS